MLNLLKKKNNGEENIQSYSEDVSSDENVHKDIEYSQEKHNGEENTQSYSEDVSSEEDGPSTEDISQHHSVKLQAVLIWLKIQTIESSIAKVKRNQAVEDVLRYNTDLLSWNIPECVLFEDNDNQRYANTFSAIDTEIISLKKKSKNITQSSMCCFKWNCEYK